MNLFLALTFIFFVGSLLGWVMELIFRRFFSRANPEHKWINPGFLVGPYLPLYGFSLTAVYLLAQIDVSFISNVVLQKIVLMILMGISITGIEYIAGIIFIHGMKIKLWDYSKQWGNIGGIICPKFTLFWILLSGIYYFLVHPYIVNGIQWLSQHLSFSFVMGFFYGVFCIDLCYSMSIMARIRKFAEDNQIVVRYEALRENIRKRNAQIKEKNHFVLSMHSEHYSFSEQLKAYLEQERAEYTEIWKEFHEKAKENIQEVKEKANEGLQEVKEKANESFQEAKVRTTETLQDAVEKTQDKLRKKK
ncbi:MAG: hypothetical protein ACI4C1_06320 [Lachnospiraceae bacterium]